MQKGLILEGGAMRGMFTAGVMDVMMENGIVFDGICGVSAGAVFGCNYKSGQMGRVIRYNKKYCQDARYCSLRSLLKTGDLYGVDFCYREIPETLDLFDKAAYQQNPAVFYVVCTDAETGEAVYKRCDKGCDEDLLWMRASASLPMVSRPVEIGDRIFMDGGMSDSIPLRFMEGIGYTKNVVVLTREAGYRKTKSKGNLLLQIALRKYPALIATIIDRHAMYNAQVEYIEKKEKAGEIFVIRPPEALNVKRCDKDPEKLQSAYDEGVRTAEKQIEALKQFLEK